MLQQRVLPRAQDVVDPVGQRVVRLVDQALDGAEQACAVTPGEGKGARAKRFDGSFPFQRALLPDVDEAEQQQAEEDAHFDQPEHAELAEHQRPREDEGDFQVER